jgi:hypothetical protein
MHAHMRTDACAHHDQQNVSSNSSISLALALALSHRVVPSSLALARALFRIKIPHLHFQVSGLLVIPGGASEAVFSKVCIRKLYLRKLCLPSFIFEALFEAFRGCIGSAEIRDFGFRAVFAHIVKSDAQALLQG